MSYSRIFSDAGKHQLFQLGRHFFNRGRGHVATPLFEAAANRGHAHAQNALGHIYLNGWGVEQNAEKAQRWFKAAADQGHTDAQFSLGKAFRDGLFGQQNKAEAQKWFKAAADQGHTDAEKFLTLLNTNTLSYN